MSCEVAIVAELDVIYADELTKISDSRNYPFCYIVCVVTLFEMCCFDTKDVILTIGLHIEATNELPVDHDRQAVVAPTSLLLRDVDLDSILEIPYPLRAIALPDHGIER